MKPSEICEQPPLHLSAETNDIGKCRLGICYKNGTGVTKDVKEAARIFRLASSVGNKGAQKELNALVEHEQGILMFLLGFHKRLGARSSITLYMDHSSMFEPGILPYISEFVAVELGE